MVLALWAVSYNLMLGYAGMVSFAHAAYYGVGAYTVALLFQRFHVPVLVGLALAPLVAAVFGLVTGLAALRAVRLYFSLLTLAISQVLFSIAFGWYAVTSGDNGIHGLDLPEKLSDFTALYYFVSAVVGVSLGLMFALSLAPFGAAVSAIRENRERGRAIGINVKAYELAVFTIAATFAGVAGGLFALFQQEAFPEMLYWTQNAQPVVVALLGGTGTFLGPAIGALVYTLLDNLLSKNFPYQFDVLLGAIVLGVVLVVPRVRAGFPARPELFTPLRTGFRHEPEPEQIESGGESIERADVGKVVRIEAVQADQARVERGEPLLVVENLSRSFGGLRAVQN